MSTKTDAKVERILTVYDDLRSLRKLDRILTPAGYDVVPVGYDPIAIMAAVRAANVALIILDVARREKPIQNLCRQIRTASDKIPILVLRATSDSAETVLLLQLGVDDYLTKPFDATELLARVRARTKWRGPAETINSTDGGESPNAMSLEDTLISVWRQVLVEKANMVTFTDGSYSVRANFRSSMREVDFKFDDGVLRGVEQNPTASSRWAKLAREGKKVMQFLDHGRYIANVVDGKITVYHTPMERAD